jgi:hypothetical protein
MGVPSQRAPLSSSQKRVIRPYDALEDGGKYSALRLASQNASFIKTTCIPVPGQRGTEIGAPEVSPWLCDPSAAVDNLRLGCPDSALTGALVVP